MTVTAHYANFCTVISKGPATPLLDTLALVHDLSGGKADPAKTKIYWDQWQALRQAMRDNHPMVKLAVALVPIDPPAPPPRQQVEFNGKVIDLLTHDELVAKFPHLYDDEGQPKDTPTHVHGRVVDAILSLPKSGSKSYVEVIIQESVSGPTVGQEPEVYLTGSVKWDGCSNWNPSPSFQCLHGCERDHLLDLGEVMARAWDAAARLMAETFDGDIPPPAAPFPPDPPLGSPLIDRDPSAN